MGRSLLGTTFAVTALFFLNKLSGPLFNVVLNNSLYSSLGILPVLIGRSFIFWLFVLVGKQITYAVQNLRYHSSQTAWHTLNPRDAQKHFPPCVLLIARRFKQTAGPGIWRPTFPIKSVCLPKC